MLYYKTTVTDSEKKKTKLVNVYSNSKGDSSKTRERSSSPEDGDGKTLNEKSRLLKNGSGPGTSKKKGLQLAKLIVCNILHAYKCTHNW